MTAKPLSLTGAADNGQANMPYADPDMARGYQREYRRLRRAGEKARRADTPGRSVAPGGARDRQRRPCHHAGFLTSAVASLPSGPRPR